MSVNEACHVDFETFSMVPIGGTNGVGSCRYAEHESTEILCLAWAIGDEEPKLWEPAQDVGILDPLADHIESGGIVKAWNCEFEMAIWPVFIEQLARDHGYIMPKIAFDQWRDTEMVAASLGFPLALGKAGAAMGLEIEKDKRGKHLLNKLAKPRRPSKNNPATRWTPESAPLDYADLYEYCRQDVRAERAIDRALPIHDLPPDELETWRMTVRLNQRGWTVDLESARKMIALLAEHKEVAHAELVRLTDGEVTTGGQRERILTWLADKHGVTLADMTKDTVADALGGNLPAPARRMLELRQELSKSSTRKYHAMLNRACRDGTVKNNLVHHGAHTGRDAGRGLQIQNFVTASVAETQQGVEDAFTLLNYTPEVDLCEAVELFYGAPPQFASKMLRPMLIAAPDHDLYCADFRSIENKITVWLAQDEGGMQLFRDGLDQYTVFYSNEYGVLYDLVTEKQRKSAKPAVLGACFMMGWKTYKKTQEKFGQVCSDERAQKAVASYRRQYPMVVKLWYGLKRAAELAVTGGKPTRYKLIRFDVRGEFLYMKLPSGREIVYYQPEIRPTRMPWGEIAPALTVMRQVGPGRTWMRVALSPGTITENAVQATARDLLMHAAKKVERLGYLSIGRIHDELVNQMHRGLGGSLEEFMACMNTKAMPRWITHPEKGYATLPIDADGWVGKRFRK